MHFHWDNFDTFAKKTLRVFGPPIINFILLLAVFSNAVASLLNWLWELAPNLLARSIEATQVEGVDGSEDERVVSQFLRALTNFLNLLGEEIKKSEIGWESVNSAAQNIVSAFGSFAYVTTIASLVSLLVLAFILDWILRFGSQILPFRLRTKERELVHHTRFASKFLNVQELLMAEAQSKGEEVHPKEESSLCKYQIWILIQAILDAEKASDSIYRHSRDGILLSIEENRKWFSYSISYFSLFIIVWSTKIDFPNEFNCYLQFMGLFSLIVSAIVLACRHIQLSIEIVELDLDIFAATYEKKNRSNFIGPATIEDHNSWRKTIYPFGWTVRDPQSSLIELPLFR